jgi:putative two-component system response regulator
MAERVLIVDDEPTVRELMLTQLRYLGHDCRGAANPQEALAVAELDRPALALLDIDLPEMSGLALLQRLKAVDENLQVVMVSGYHDLETVRQSLRQGAYDYLVKPFELEDLAATVDRALERYRLIRQNEEYQRNLERMVQTQTEAIRQTRDIALLTLAKLAESRDNETGHHLERIAAYSQRLAEELARGPYARRVGVDFIATLWRSSPLHDIGKVGIPDAILLKPGPLTADEWVIMREHTRIGGDTLRSVIEQYTDHTFLTMAMEIAYSHHERWDGRGYPAGVAEERIPLAARIVALADAYDAITSQRPYKPALPHEDAVRRIVRDRGTHFDPHVADAFVACQGDIARIHRRLADPEVQRQLGADGAGPERAAARVSRGLRT